MAVEPNDLMLFARVAHEGSFSRAAERAGLPKSTLSRRIAALEGELGERLLLRTTRKLTLTDFGRNVLEHANQIVAEAEAASALAQHRQVAPSGRLRISMPADFAMMLPRRVLADFIAAHPLISIELDLSARRVDLIGENFDIALRMGELPDDATLAARSIGSLTNALFASPDYLRRRGSPVEPADLMKHDTLRLLRRNGDTAPWRLQRGDEHWEGEPPARAIVNSPLFLADLAAAGTGIASVHHLYAAPYLERGDLVAVLPEWQLPPGRAWAVFPGRRLMPARTRAFIEALAASEILGGNIPDSRNMT